jgi:hypothetical protein
LHYAIYYYYCFMYYYYDVRISVVFMH